MNLPQSNPGQGAGRPVWNSLTQARIEPLPRAQQGWLMRLVLHFSRTRTDAGGARPAVLNVLATLAKAPGLFYRWLLFASALMPYGKLPRADTERVILRVAMRTGSLYEWAQHVRIAQTVGLDLDEINSFQEPKSALWSPRTQALLAAVDQLVAWHHLEDAHWQALRAHLNERELIELCLLVGHYVMLAMTLNSLGVQVEPQYQLTDSDNG